MGAEVLQHIKDGLKPKVLDTALAVAVDGHPQVLENRMLGQSNESNVPKYQCVCVCVRFLTVSPIYLLFIDLP